MGIRSFLKSRLPTDRSSRLKRRISVAFWLFVVLFSAFLVYFNHQVSIAPLYESKGISFVRAQVTAVVKDNLQSDGSRVGSQMVKVKILSGAHKGQTYEADSLDSYLYGAACRTGTRVIVQLSESGQVVTASVYNYDRSTVLYLLFALFVFFLWLIGRKQGLRSAFALVFSLMCVLLLYLPMLYIGCSPFLAAVAVVSVTTVVSLYLMGGASLKTLAAMISTVSGVIGAGLVAVLFGQLAHISGYNVSDVENLIFIAQNSRLNVGDLLFSGILISSLGAAMDNSVSIASALSELSDRSPSLTARQLFESGIHVGRDMMSTTTNTLIFAYTGSSVTVLITMYAYHYPYLQVINMYSIGIEILQALSGTLGVIFTVPICAAVSAWIYRRNPTVQAKY